MADSLGLHLDQCQRIVADPCSLTVIRYTPLRPFLLRLNDTGGGVDDLLPPPPKPAGAQAAGAQAAESDAVIGGGAGNRGAVAPASAGTASAGTASADPTGPAQVADTAHGAEG